MELLKPGKAVWLFVGLTIVTSTSFSADRAKVILLGSGTPIPDPIADHCE